MSGQVLRGSAGDYQSDERAGVARLSWRVSGTLDCCWGKEGDDQGEGSTGSHPKPPAHCPQALAFPDQLYDAVFDGAQVTSKTPIRLYGGALLSEYCWADAWKVMSNCGGDHGG